jgi:Outer membrane protein beta-barrel domain
MRSLILPLVILSAATAAFAQQWEFGAVGGVGLLNTVSASGAAGSATAGFANGAVAGAYFGQTLNHNLTGEIRYEYFQSDLRLSSNGQSTQFTGSADAIHYDLLYHTNRKESRTQFFVSVGGGMKLFRGSGAQQAYQPLSQFGYFTKTQAIKPMGTVGAGLMYQLAPKLFLRAEVRDFITPFPSQVLTPAPGIKYGGILMDIVPTVGISYVY